MKYINNRHLIIIKNVIHKKNKIIVNLGIIGRDDIELFRIIFLPFFPPLFTFCVSALRIKRTMFTIFFINEYKLKIMNIYFFRFTFFSSFFFFMKFARWCRSRYPLNPRNENRSRISCPSFASPAFSVGCYFRTPLACSPFPPLLWLGVSLSVISAAQNLPRELIKTASSSTWPSVAEGRRVPKNKWPNLRTTRRRRNFISPYLVHTRCNNNHRSFLFFIDQFVLFHSLIFVSRIHYSLILNLHSQNLINNFSFD